MDPFEHLPVEIIRPIILEIADFCGVESLVLVSTRVRSVFLADARAITTNLLVSNPITSMSEIQQLYQGISAIHSSSMDCTNLEDFQESCSNTPNLPEQMSKPELFQIIRTAARIQRLACLCLYTMRHNFIAAVEMAMGPAQAEKAGGAFIWMEEYRVYWALWHLLQYSELRKTAQGRWNWPTESLVQLDEYNIWNAVPVHRREQILAVAAVLADLGLDPIYAHTDRGSQDKAEEAKWAAFSYPDKTPIPLFQSLELPANWNEYPIWSPPSPPDANPLAPQRAACTPKHASKSTLGSNMLHSYGRQLSRSRNPSWEMMKMPPYRRIGVIFWDSLRMLAAGLVLGRSVALSSGLESENNIPLNEMIARWLALVGKQVP